MEISLDKDHPSLVVIPKMWELVIEEHKYQTACMYVTWDGWSLERNSGDLGSSAGAPICQLSFKSQALTFFIFRTERQLSEMILGIFLISVLSRVPITINHQNVNLMY